MGKCFAMFLGSLTVIAAVQLWDRMPMDGLDTDIVDEDTASDCRCFGLDLNHDGKVFLLILVFVA